MKGVYRFGGDDRHKVGENPINRFNFEDGMYREINAVSFPKFRDININMMPIVCGDIDSVPDFAKHYWDLISQCPLETGSIVYLTIHEGLVEKDKTLRRPGIHTDGTNQAGWGGGGWGDSEGIYMASTDGRCRVWDCMTHKVDHMGACELPEAKNQVMKPNWLYWMTDRTPHESLPAEKTANRQFFRLVSNGVGVWYAKHSTPNPLGVKPNCPIETRNKF